MRGAGAGDAEGAYEPACLVEGAGEARHAGAHDGDHYVPQRLRRRRNPPRELPPSCADSSGAAEPSLPLPAAIPSTARRGNTGDGCPEVSSDSELHIAKSYFRSVPAASRAGMAARASAGTPAEARIAVAACWGGNGGQGESRNA